MSARGSSKPAYVEALEQRMDKFEVMLEKVWEKLDSRQPTTSTIIAWIAAVLAFAGQYIGPITWRLDDQKAAMKEQAEIVRVNQIELAILKDRQRLMGLPQIDE